MFKRDRPYSESESETWCNGVGFAGPYYYNLWWKLQEHVGASEYLDAHFEFHEGAGGDSFCDMLESILDSLAASAPEFAVADIELGEAAKVGCGCAEGNEECLVKSNENKRAILFDWYSMQGNACVLSGQEE
ncbi:hypothetical protein SUNI508_10162 [Seiridium unicorne]|uniref:Uncharacterized protein n=1 Tax=Seiridium unicorne TaxID=138068 RepID=A0ABR2UM16_9PEZI